jgi:hypothetical protein
LLAAQAASQALPCLASGTAASCGEQLRDHRADVALHR